ncbi:MAG: hypothetical protein KY459_10605 [Acidobacteria bacterium]|nr:hypothetical protein [Acidobacteriota bacterium]
MKSLVASVFVTFVAVFALAGEAPDHCATAAHAAAHEKGAHHEGAHSCDHAETKSVTLEGELLCRHCNLHETDFCEKVFVSSAGERFPLCPESDMAALEKVAAHGEATIEVDGSLMTHSDGGRMLRVETARAAALGD